MEVFRGTEKYITEIHGRCRENIRPKVINMKLGTSRLLA